MKKKILLLIIAICSVIGIEAQPKFNERPKLVVGIVVDQMRWDYLSRYYNKFSEDGYRRMIDQGYSFNNCLINYIPTVTAVGHASVYTGTTPAFHGIAGNNFCIDGRKTYCCTDPTVKPVGSDNEKKGQMSPVNLLATTIGDQLRLHTDFRSKVIGISYKDRGAIMPAGHSANAAYWLDTKDRQFITSTYYMTELPKWVKEYNKKLIKNEEFKKVGDKVGLYPLTGHITADMAIAALDGEQLGKGDETDMLCISFSETDIIGHEYSTRGEHTDEAYLELDKDLSRLFRALDEKVGKGQWLAFLTADHAAAHNWKFMQDHKLNGGKWETDDLKSSLEQYLKDKLRLTRDVVVTIDAYRIFLDHEAIVEQDLRLKEVKLAAIEFLKKRPNVSFVVDFEEAGDAAIPNYLRERILNGYNFHRSGDIIVCVEPGYYEFGRWSSPIGTTHGEWNPYDAHIPLLFLGWQVPHGECAQEVHITDIAPTVCSLLHIQQPNATIGNALLFK